MEKHITLYNEIGYWGTNANDVRWQLEDSKSTSQIVLHINSPGGEVFDGFAIYNMLVASEKSKKGIVEGLCASIATIILMACEEREMNEASLFMIHNPWNVVQGDADAMESQAEALRQIEDTMVAIYAKRTGLGETKIRNLMKNETWMNAQTALDYGFVTKITNNMPVAYAPEGCRAVAKLDPAKLSEIGHSLATFNAKSDMSLSQEDKGWVKNLLAAVFGAKNQAEAPVTTPEPPAEPAKTGPSVEELQQKLAQEQEEKAALQEQITALNSEKAALEGQVTAKTSEVVTLQNKLAKSEQFVGEVFGEGKTQARNQVTEKPWDQMTTKDRIRQRRAMLGN